MYRRGSWQVFSGYARIRQYFFLLYMRGDKYHPITGDPWCEIGIFNGSGMDRAA